MKNETKICRNCKKEFTIEPDDFTFYEKIGVPPPTFCPECRFERRLLWRNERTYYRRTCDLCKRNIISVYPAHAVFPVYCQKCWWGDSWDPTSYGRDFDFSRPFFEQYQELQNVVPALSIMNDDGVGSVNSEYTYDWAFSKNVYMCVCGWHVENGLYSYHINHAKEIMDCFHVEHSEFMYNSVNCQTCYGCISVMHCTDCRNCLHSFDLKGCSDCLYCVGLRNKRFCILNIQYSESEYKEKLAEFKTRRKMLLREYQKQFDALMLAYPHKYAFITKSVSSTGNCLRNCKNSRFCFNQNGLENCKFMVIGDGGKDSYDCNNTGNPELCYDSVTPDNSRGNKSTVFCWKCTEAEYSNNCHSCTSVFGSTGLKHTPYAILNKKYTKEEFVPLREKIVAHMKKTGEWGEFFSAKLSPFAYNETAALDWFPIPQDEAVKKGYRWKEPDKKEYQITQKADDLPDTITEVNDSITGEIIGCAHEAKCNERCTRAFKIVPAELLLYRKFDVPLPRLCPNCRHYSRLKLNNPPRLWHRKCTCGGVRSENDLYQNTIEHFHKNDHCPNEFETSYSPDPLRQSSSEARRPEIVYCESCYNSEIV